ncbi:uncharacterized protein Tre1p [[Candida] jaroonii]|uniref:Uncharacterized protein Tre1p n=1 Tax=[Candida] jaroonii TaxID=467808 RepID=A0ACA9Y9M9_9ASCO|nr:uncharacterized protein Tre1p [[Candida] jaroonii]
MTGSNGYERVANDSGGDNITGSSVSMPFLPPSYDEAYDGSEDTRVGNANEMEQFEIDDFDVEGVQRDGFLTRASLITKKLAMGVSNSYNKVTKMIDPIYEGLSFLNMQYEKVILKVGNPLVVKRLLYVFFMVFIVFLVSHYTINEGVNGTSGGAFSSGKFYDIDILSSIIEDHIDMSNMQNHLEYFSSMPHLAGTSGDLALAKYIETYMKNNGVQTIENFELKSYTNYPRSKSFVKLSDDSFEAKLHEGDEKSIEYLSHNPNSLKTDQPIEGKMVFVNFGTEDDFQKLQEGNIDVKDCILLMRYGGGIIESNKVLMAQDKGAKAVIFISRKISIGKDDSVAEYDDVIQRENVGLSRYSSGDILTPGWSSDEGYGSKLLWMKSKTTPKIPTIPISFKDGETLIKIFNGKGIKFQEDSFSGPTDDDSKKLKIHVSNSERDTHALWNVIGTIQGREQHDKSIIIGAARDASCFGTVGSNTGSVVLLEMIKIFTTMQRKYNWTPSRTIKFISFDGTNYNLAGSTEWVEENKRILRSQAYTYIDLSDAVSGDNLSIKANPFLHQIIKDCLKNVGSKSIQSKRNSKIQHKDKTINLYELYKLQNQGSDAISNDLIEERNYIPFINILNVPSMEIKFKGTKYARHSCYDNYDNFDKAKIDPSMKKHGQLVELLSNIVLNVAEQAVIPFKFTQFVDRLFEYQVNLAKYIDEQIKKDTHPSKPQVHYDKLIKALNVLKEGATDFDNWVHSWNEFIVQSADIEPSLLAMKRWKWNDCLVEFNQHFISKDIQQARPGYLNMLFGTSFNAPVKSQDEWNWNTFPLIRDFVDKGDFGRAQFHIDELAGIIEYSAREFTAY